MGFSSRQGSELRVFMGIHYLQSEGGSKPSRISDKYSATAYSGLQKTPLCTHTQIQALQPCAGARRAGGGRKLMLAVEIRTTYAGVLLPGTRRLQPTCPLVYSASLNTPSAPSSPSPQRPSRHVISHDLSGGAVTSGGTSSG